MKEFTMEELSRYTGQDDGPVYVALRGTVYDVSTARTFYGVGGPYELFAGKEVSRALALMKIDIEECNDDLSGLTDKQLATLQDWVQKFHQKYKVVGKVKGSRAAPAKVAAAVKAASCPARKSMMAGSGALTAIVALWVSVLAFAWYKHTTSSNVAAA